MNSAVITAIWNTAMLALLWILYAWLYRSYRVDVFRQRVFALRDELFDLAAGGKLSFDDPAYALLRTTLNGSIRFAHRIAFLDLVLWSTLSARPRAELDSIHGSFESRWDRAIARHPEDVQAELRRIRGAMHYHAAEHIAVTSPLFWATVLPALLWVICWIICKVCVANTAAFYRRMVGNSLPNRLRDDFDAAAYLTGSAAAV